MSLQVKKKVISSLEQICSLSKLCHCASTSVNLCFREVPEIIISSQYEAQACQVNLSGRNI